LTLLRWLLAPLAIFISVIAGLGVCVIATVFVIFATESSDTGGAAQIANLKSNVSVIRDAHSVPHIFAGNRLDAYRALGFVHAQDRFFQMEFARRTAAGRLSEVVGPLGLRSDRFMRTLGIYRLAEASVEQLSPNARASVDAYAEGVNAWLTSPNTRRPAELIALGITPEPWRPADSTAWVRLMALLLSGDWRTEILKAQLSKTLTNQQMRDLWPDEPAGGPKTLALSSNTHAQLASITDALPDIFPEASASNEWVVSGSRSASGKPLLANDPHLGLTAPGMWHLARIVTPGFKASGAAIPGQPFFMVGQNEHLSWGLTTTHADTQDLFIERLRPDDPKQYITPTGSQPFETRIEEVHIRGRGTPERLVVRTSRHGPIISDISPSALNLANEGSVVALSFAAFRDDDGTANAIYGMNTAETTQDFLTALREFHAPMQNVAYAHTDGSFGFVAAGRLPIRPGGPGNRPHAGWDGEHDWAGFVPFEDLPQSRNPAAGYLVNANNRVAPREYPHVIANDWPEGYRAQRILNLLAETPLHSAESFAAIQNDVVSLAARDLTRTMLGTLTKDDRNLGLHRKLSEWNGDMSAHRIEPLLYAALLDNLRNRMINDELGELETAYRGPPIRALIHMLTSANMWCENGKTILADACQTIVGLSMLDAIGDIESTHGYDRELWRWGKGHTAPFAHPILRFAGPLNRWFGPNISTDGGNHTINRGTYHSPGQGRFPHMHGPGLRAIFDMANPGEAKFMIAPGQSGKMNSPHFTDLAQSWADGAYIVLKGDMPTLRTSATAELTLTP
jgi:penicillin G amidase